MRATDFALSCLSLVHGGFMPSICCSDWITCLSISRTGDYRQENASDALKGFVAVSSGTVVPAWISCDTETPLGEIFCTVSFLKGYLSMDREFRVGSEQRGKSCCALPSHVCLKAHRRWNFSGLAKASTGTSRGVVIFWLHGLRLENIVDLVGEWVCSHYSLEWNPCVFLYPSGSAQQILRSLSEAVPSSGSGQVGLWEGLTREVSALPPPIT